MNTTLNNVKKEFTIDDALKIQLEHLRKWKLVLNPQTYLDVLDIVIEKNKKGYKSPYDVCRGSDIDNIIVNIMNNY
jgi:hypothetical protein